MSHDKGEGQIVTQTLESNIEEVSSNPNNTNSENVELTCEILDSTNQDMEEKSELNDIKTEPEIGPTNKTDKEQKEESVTEVIQSNDTGTLQPHPNPSNPSYQQIPPSQPNSKPAAQSEPSMRDLISLVMQTKELVVAKADETNVKIEAMNVKLDKTSAEIISLGQEMDEEGSQVRSQVKAVLKEVADIKEQQKVITNRALQ